MSHEILAVNRVEQGTGASRRLRRAGKVPGIVYGADKAPQAIELDHNDLYHALQHESFHASILKLTVDGAAEQVLVRDTHYHPWKQQVMHIDFQRVNPNEKIHIKVPLHFVNADIAPGIKLAGGTVSHITTEVEVSCLPGQLPEFIEVDLKDLNAGQSLHLSDLTAPEGVEFVAVKAGENVTLASVIGAKGGKSEE